MYKYRSKQISFTDFNTPIGMKLNPNNRWVKKAEMIPWDEIEQRYAKLFTNRKGNVAKPLRLALGACIIQAEYGYSDEEVALQIQETAYLQFFCGYTEYNDEKPPFDPSLDAYNEALKLSDMIERYKERTGCYPERILADKIYRNRENLSYCAERKIRLSGPALGRPKKDEICDKKQDYIDESERVEVERKFSLAKRKCGIGLIVTRLKETTCHCLAMSVLLLNLRKIGKVLFTIFLLWFQKLLKIYNDSKMAIVQ